MAIVEELRPLGERNLRDDSPRTPKVGPIGRLGRYTATHFRVVLVGWLLLAVVLGFFAPRVETALSGAGWETSGSQSVQARQLINHEFGGLSSYGLMTVLYSPARTVADPAYQRVIASVERTLRANPAVVGIGAVQNFIQEEQDRPRPLGQRHDLPQAGDLGEEARFPRLQRILHP